jgi:hypothetical protein
MTERVVSTDWIATCVEVDRLQNFRKNATERNRPELARVAFDRLVELGIPSGASTPVDRAFWRTVGAYEAFRSEDAGKTVRATRTRQKARRATPREIIAELMLRRQPSDGFAFLRSRGRLDLPFENKVLDHASEFAPEVVAAAETRLAAAD